MLKNELSNELPEVSGVSGNIVSCDNGINGSLSSWQVLMTMHFHIIIALPMSIFEIDLCEFIILFFVSNNTIIYSV